MKIEVRLPQIAEGVETATIVEVLVSQGDNIIEGQDVLELETEKAVASLPSSVSGKVLKIQVRRGDEIRVGDLLMILETQTVSKPAAKIPSTRARPDNKLQSPILQKSSESAMKQNSSPPASPSIRRMARDLGISLERVRGSQEGGRIGRADLRAYIQYLQQMSQGNRAGADGSQLHAEPFRAVDFSRWGPVTRKPLVGIRKAVSQKIHKSWNAIPHVTQFDNVDMTQTDRLRKKYLLAYKKNGVKLSFMPFVLKAVALTLKSHPMFNASLDESSQEVVMKEYVHIGIAVDTEAGLMVPVIRDVDKKSLLELAQETLALAARARARTIGVEEMQGASFTISNQGALGSTYFTPIINQPEVAILGLGRTSPKPVVYKSKIRARPMMPITLSYDHRLIDGADAVRFILRLIDQLEQFDEKLVKKMVSQGKKIK